MDEEEEAEGSNTLAAPGGENVNKASSIEEETDEKTPTDLKASQH